MNFENKTAVVTGGSRGIGLAIAKKLAEGGANIAILYVGDESEGINAKAELEKYGTKVEQYFCNVADFAASKEVVDKVIADFGGIDILINNAGITRDKLVLNMEEADFDAVIEARRQDRQHLVDRRTYRQRGSGELLRFKGRHHRSDKVRSERACGQRRDRQRRSSRLHRHRYDKRPLRQGKGEHAGSDPR